MDAITNPFKCDIIVRKTCRISHFPLCVCYHFGAVCMNITGNSAANMINMCIELKKTASVSVTFSLAKDVQIELTTNMLLNYFFQIKITIWIYVDILQEHFLGNDLTNNNRIIGS